MAARRSCLHRILICGLLLIAIAAGVWWAGTVRYDPMAIYRPIPASATLVGRHLVLPERWMDLLANPLALALMRTAGIEPEEAADLVLDEESRAWFEKLAGNEAVGAYLPSRFGGSPSWIAVSHLGGESQKLRWQLTLFNVPGFRRLTQFDRRSVWWVETPDLPPGQHLVIAFGEGILMACISPGITAIAEVLGADDGLVPRLLDEAPGFAAFAEEDDRQIPDRLWVLDERDWTLPDPAGLVVEFPVLKGDAISMRVSTPGEKSVPEAEPPPPGMSALSGRLGGAPCAAVRLSGEAVRRLAAQPWMPSDVRYALRKISVMAPKGLLAFAMDGEMGGRLAWGAMGSLGLRGLRVPTLLLATPAVDAETADRGIREILDSCNARYKGAFVLRPVDASSARLYALESAGGNEWVDELSPSDRPAYGVLNGWLLASSNLQALQKLAREAVSGRAEERNEAAAWLAQLSSPAAGSAWVELARTGKVAKDAIATWSMAQLFLQGGNSRQAREQLNQTKAWIDALAPFGTARAVTARKNGKTVLELDLGLSEEIPSDKIAAP